MFRLFLIGLGGFAGALLRHSITTVVQNWSSSGGFPYGTLVVNLLGCLLIGAFSALVEFYGFFSAEVRSFVFIGLLGAFTTYSTFGSETVGLFREGIGLLPLANIALHIGLGLAAVWLGRFLVLSLWP